MQAMRAMLAGLVVLAGVISLTADEKLPTLKVGKETYTNVTVIKVTTVDINFMHARGIGNAKLKDLEPEMQKHFHYDAAAAGAVLQKQYQANAEYRQAVLTNHVVPPNMDREPSPPPQDSAPDVVIPVKDISAKRFLGGPPPAFVVDKWLTAAPDANGKFILIDFWATWCGPCRRAIPELNGYQARYRDRLVVVGISNESEADVRAMTTPQMQYSVAIDPQARMKRAVEVRGIPHAILIDPHGIVRFEGHPGYLSNEGLEKLFARYGN